MEKNITSDYLRLSVTDRCNLNCMYCTPLQKSQFLTHQEVLRHEEIVRLMKIFVSLGIRKIRLTGGEPLLKKNIIGLIKMLKGIKGIQEISMTTNGVLLNDYAFHLKEAGLDRINISIDTLKKDRFKSISGMDCFDNVYTGIHKALKIGLEPIKLNVVPMKGVNDDEIIDFARLTLKLPLIVRFIEFFHTNQRSKSLINSLIPTKDIKERITKEIGTLDEVFNIKGNGPSNYYKLKQAKGSIGFISGETTNFCHKCNRIRVDCAGRISPCLFYGHTYDTRLLLRSSSRDGRLFKEIERVFCLKSQYTKDIVKERKIEMSSVGG